MKIVKVLMALFAAVILLNMQTTPARAHSHHEFHEINCNFTFDLKSFAFNSNVEFNYVMTLDYVCSKCGKQVRIKDGNPSASGCPKSSNGKHDWQCTGGSFY